MMSRVENALAFFSRGLLGCAALAVVAMTALVSLSVVMRYVVGSPFAFTEELVALLYLAMAFLTIPIGTIRREHIVVSVAVERAGPRTQRVLALLAAVVMVVFAVWFVVAVAAIDRRRRGPRCSRIRATTRPQSTTTRARSRNWS